MHHFSKQPCEWNTINQNVPTILNFISKYKVPWILKWQYNIVTPKYTETFELQRTEIKAVVINHGQTDMVTRQFFVKWWDKFNHERIIGQVKKEFPISTVTPTQAEISSKPVPSISMVSPEPNKAFTSGTKSAPRKAPSSKSKAVKPNRVSWC